MLFFRLLWIALFLPFTSFHLIHFFFAFKLPQPSFRSPPLSSSCSTLTHLIIFWRFALLSIRQISCPSSSAANLRIIFLRLFVAWRSASLTVTFTIFILIFGFGRNIFFFIVNRFFRNQIKAILHFSHFLCLLVLLSTHTFSDFLLFPYREYNFVFFYFSI